MQIHLRAKPCACALSAALIASCAPALSACGGGGSSKGTSAASAVTGVSGATGATSGSTATPSGTSGTSGAAGSPKRSAHARKQRKQSSSGGGASVPSQSSGATQGGSKKQASSGGGKGGGSKPKKVASDPTKNYTGQQKELYREAKIVCGALTLNGLAHEYGVKRTPDAVARAYSHTYDVTLRGAVYEGCKSAFVK
jgi:hypothetical protein